MKNSLSMLAMLSFVTPSVVPLFNQNIVGLTQSNNQSFAKEIYWNKDYTEIEIFNTWKGSAEKVFIYTVNFGQDKVLNYKTFSVIDSNSASYTKTSWGNTEYLGMPFGDFQKKDVEESISQGKVESVLDVRLSVIFALLDISGKSGWAEMVSWQKIGLSYYRENGSNYMQIFGIQYAESWWSFSGGGMWLNLGQGIRFES